MCVVGYSVQRSCKQIQVQHLVLVKTHTCYCTSVWGVKIKRCGSLTTVIEIFILPSLTHR